MEIYFSDIMADAKRHLSIIGKRLTDEQGKNLFSNITTSTAEDPIFNQYIKAGGQNVVAALRQMVKEYYYRQSEEGVAPNRVNSKRVNELPAISSDIKGAVYELPDGKQYTILETNSVGIDNEELVLGWFRVNVRSSDEPCIVIQLDNERANEDIDNRAKELISTYITLFTVGEYLSMTRPDVAQKYQNDIAGAMQTLVAYVYHKEPPTATEKNPLSLISTTVE